MLFFFKNLKSLYLNNMSFDNSANAIDQKIGQKMAGLKKKRKSKIAQIKKTPGAGEPFGSDPYEIEDEKLSQEEINSLYEKAKDIENEKQENPDYDISGMKISSKEELNADTIGKGNRIAVPETVEGELIEEKKSGAEEVEKGIIEDLGGKKFEEKDKQAQERAKRLEELKTELEIARKEYAEMYFKKRKMWDRAKEYFGDKFTKEGRERAGRAKMDASSVVLTESGKRAEIYNDQDINYMQAIYENKLIDYRNFILEDMEARGIQGEELKKELAEAMKFFNFDETVSLYDAKTEARVEANSKDDSKWGRAKEIGAKIIKWYIKQPAWKKLAFAGIILGGTAASSALGLGTAVAGAFTLVNFGRRILTGAASAVGTEALSEKIAGKLREKKSNKEIDEYLKGIENFDFGDFNKFLAQKTFDVNKKFEKRNLGSFLRKSGAIAFGGLVGSGTFGRMISFASEKTGLGEFLKEHFTSDSDLYKYSPPGQEGAGPSGGTSGPDAAAGIEEPGGGSPVGESKVENPNLDADAPQGTNVPEEELQGETEGESTVLGVQKGSSLEGSIIQHLKEHPELVEKYNELSGGRKFNPGQIAHRMALDYAEKYPESFPQGPPSLVHEGTGIRINLETMEIEDIQSEKGLGYLPENEGGGKIQTEEIKTSAVIEENQQSTLEKQQALKKELSEMNISERDRIMQNLQERLGENENEINTIEDQPASKYNTNEPWKYDEDLDKLKVKNRDIWSDIHRENSIPDVLREIRQDICLGDIDGWRQIKDLAIDNPNAFSGVNDEVKNRLSNLYVQSHKLVGDLARPRPGETVARWTERITRLVVTRK